MVDLPVVVLKKVFAFLDIRERLRVRSTCKTWRFMVDTLSYQQSLCIYSISYPYNKRWCFSDQRVVEDEMIYLKLDREAGHRFDLRMEFFRNLQKVYLYKTGDKTEHFLEEVNQLTRLQVLMIKESWIKLRTLSSSSLERLSLKLFCCDHIKLDTPNLSSFVLWVDRRGEIYFPPGNHPGIVEFHFPLKVKHLECTEFNLNLGQLKNLETLVCRTITFDFKLDEFKSLVRTELWSLDAFQLMRNEKNRLNRASLQIVASGFDGETVAGELIGIQEEFFCRPERFGGSHLELSGSYLKNAERNQWNLVGSIPWNFQVEYATLLPFVSRIPKDFFSKLRISQFNLTEFPLNVSEIDQATLVELMERSQPSFLKLNFKLSQDTFERIGRIQSIKSLFVRLNEKLDCLLSLRNLEVIRIFDSAKISIDFICRLFKQLKFFSILLFFPNLFPHLGLLITYHKNRLEEEDDFVLEYPFSIHFSSSEKLCRDLNELVEEVEKLRENQKIQDIIRQ